jgi:hypothetical protein
MLKLKVTDKGNLAEKMSRQPSIQAVALLLLSAFREVAE